MFFEDEKDKDIIIDPETDLEISDDGTVSWDDILVDNDEIVSIKDSKAQNVAQNQTANTAQDNTTAEETVASVDDLIDLGDDLELIDDGADDVDDEELRKILSSDSSSQSPKQKAFDAFGSDGNQSPQADTDDSALQEDFDIDANLASAAEATGINTNRTLKNKAPRSEIKVASNSKKSSLSLLIAILVAVLVGGGIYYYSTSYSEEEMLANLPAKQQAIQEELNNTTQEDIANRTQNDNIPVVNEEQVQELPIQNEEQQKKETVAVIQTGRTDPFVPLEKYTTFVVEKPKPVVVPKKKKEIVKQLDFPLPPMHPDNVANVAKRVLKKLDTFKVSGIMYDEKNPAAIIKYDNASYFIKKGDIIEDFTVQDIKRNYITLANGQNKFVVKVAEELDSNYSTTTPKGLIGTGKNRLYKDITSYEKDGDKENKNNEEDRNNDYTSAEDIEVNERQ